MSETKRSAPASLNLTQRPPRSPRVKLGGYVMLPRIIDKGRAALAGQLGEYHYAGKGMDRHFFEFTGADHASFQKQIANNLGDWDLLLWIQENGKNKRQPWEIAAWSEYHEKRTPDSDAETAKYFMENLAKFSQAREDIRTWFDLMDLDDYCSFGGAA
jgi:hypothetical protein